MAGQRPKANPATLRHRAFRPKPASEPKDPSAAALERDPETSARLAQISGADTSAERLVRRAVFALGLRFRVRNRDLEGSPDLANRKRLWAIFVHGCFWHHHRGCARATFPKRNADFWGAKFAANRARDHRVQRQLRKRGYMVLTIWECETADRRLLRRRLKDLVSYSLGNRDS